MDLPGHSQSLHHNSTVLFHQIGNGQQEIRQTDCQWMGFGLGD